jgi:hypothetical protein
MDVVGDPVLVETRIGVPVNPTILLHLHSRVSYIETGGSAIHGES